MGRNSLRGSVATEGGGGGGGGGVSPPTVGSFFIFRLENVQSGTYLEGNFDEYLKIRMESSYFLEIMTYPLFPLNCYSLADWPRSRNITRTKSLFMYHYVAHK